MSFVQATDLTRTFDLSDPFIVRAISRTPKRILTAVDKVSFSIEKGTTYALVGESGSGKTSLIMLIAGLEKATSGQIYFQNQEITKLSEDEVSKIRRKNIGIVFQSFYLIPNYTAVENVALTLELNKFKDPYNQAKELLERFGLKHRFNNLPSQLSGGEQQRVAIARSIAMKPELILADEPTGNLDPDTAESVMALMRELDFQSTALVVVTHDPQVAERMDRQYRLSGGKLSLSA